MIMSSRLPKSYTNLLNGTPLATETSLNRAPYDLGV